MYASDIPCTPGGTWCVSVRVRVSVSVSVGVCVSVNASDSDTPCTREGT